MPMSDIKVLGFSQPQLVTIAQRIEARCQRDQIIHLLPATGFLCARALRIAAFRPRREDVALMFCGSPRCERRDNCYSCLGKANAVMQLFDKRVAWRDG